MVFLCSRLLPAQISFTQHQVRVRVYQAEIGNQIQFGSLLFKLTGPAQYLGKKNLLAFDFTHMQLSMCCLQWRVCGKRRKWISTINPLPNSLCVLGDWRLHCRSRSWRWTSALGRRLETFPSNSAEYLISSQLQALLRLLARHRFERVNGFDATMTQQNCPNKFPAPQVSGFCYRA